MAERADVNLIDRLTSERALSQHVFDLARTLGWMAARYPTWHRTSTTAGFPDLVLVRPPRLLFVELKSERGELTAAQQDWWRAIAGVPGVEYYCWRPRDRDRWLEVLT